MDVLNFTVVKLLMFFGHACQSIWKWSVLMSATYSKRRGEGGKEGTRDKAKSCRMLIVGGFRWRILFIVIFFQLFWRLENFQYKNLGKIVPGNKWNKLTWRSMCQYYKKWLTRIKIYYIRIKLFGGSRMKSLFINFCKWMMVDMKLPLWFLDFIGTFKSNETILF